MFEFLIVVVRDCEEHRPEINKHPNDWKIIVLEGDYKVLVEVKGVIVDYSYGLGITFLGSTSWITD